MPVGAPLGNTNGAKSRVFEQALKRAALKDDWKRLHAGVEKVWDAVEQGDRWAIEFVRDTLDGKPKPEAIDTRIELTLRFERIPEQWREIDQDVTPALESQLERQPQVVQDTMRLVLDGVPQEHQQKVYDHAISTALAAATRGDGELPDKDMAEKADVAEAAPGFGSSLDTETEEERARFEDALAAVQAHNATVRARKT